MTPVALLSEALPGAFWDGAHGNMLWAIGSIILGFFTLAFVAALVRVRWSDE